MKRKPTKYDAYPTLSYSYNLGAQMAYDLLKIYGNAEDINLNLRFSSYVSAQEFFNYMIKLPEEITLSNPSSVYASDPKLDAISDKAKNKLLNSFSEPVLNFYCYARMIELNKNRIEQAALLKDKKGNIHWWVASERALVHILYVLNQIGGLSEKALKSSIELRKKVRETGIYGDDVDFRSYQYKSLIPTLQYAGERIWLGNQ